MEYKLIDEMNLEQFNKELNKLTNEGWTIFGNYFVYYDSFNTRYTQMFKKSQ